MLDILVPLINDSRIKPTIENLDTDTQVLVSDIKGTRYITFADSSGFIFRSKDWNTNLTLSKIKVKLGDDVVRLHTGYYNAFKSIVQDLVPYIENSPYPVYFYGHSLGGALATIAYLYFRNILLVQGCVTTGCPSIFGFLSKFRIDLHSRFSIINYYTRFDPLLFLPPFFLNYWKVGNVKLIGKNFKFKDYFKYDTNPHYYRSYDV